MVDGSSRAPAPSWGMVRVLVVSFFSTWAWALPGMILTVQGRPEVFAVQAGAVFAAAALSALLFPALVARLGPAVVLRMGGAFAALGALAPLFGASLLLVPSCGAFLVSLGGWAVYLPLKGALSRHLAPSRRPWIPTVFDAGTIVALVAAAGAAALSSLPEGAAVVSAAVSAAALLAVSWPVPFCSRDASHTFQKLSGQQGRLGGPAAAGAWAMLPFAAAFAFVSGAAEASPAVAASASESWGSVAAAGMGAGIVLAPLLVRPLAAAPLLLRLVAPLVLGVYLLPLSAPLVFLAAAGTMALAQVGFLLGDLAASRLDDGYGSAFSGSSALWYLAASPATALAAVQMPSRWLLVVAAAAVVALPLSLVRSALAGVGRTSPGRPPGSS